MYDLGLSSIDNLKQDPSFWHKKTYENHIFINDVPFHSSHSVGALWQIQIQTNSHETEMSKSSGIWEVFIPTSRQSHAQLIKQFWKETEIYKWQARKLQATLVSKLCWLTHSLTGVRCRATSVAKNTKANTNTDTNINTHELESCSIGHWPLNQNVEQTKLLL